MGFRDSLYPVKTSLLDLLCDASAGLRRFDPKENLIISSYPRSGSTWLAELLVLLPRTAMLWEPLHLRRVREFADLGFGWRQHIPKHENWPEARGTFEALFSGQMLNHWLASRSSPVKFCSADRMVVKFVRANGLLPWLTQQFDFNKKPVYLLRHPFAVAASQMKEGSWDEEFENYRIPDMPFNGIYRKHESFLSSLKTKQEVIVADWCVNNNIVLDNERYDRDWTAIHYENLLSNPESTLRHIFDRWATQIPKGMMDQLQEASSTTVESTFQKSKKAQLEKWRHFFAADELKQMQHVLDYFEVDIYSGDALLPGAVTDRKKDAGD